MMDRKNAEASPGRPRKEAHACTSSSVASCAHSTVLRNARAASGLALTAPRPLSSSRQPSDAATLEHARRTATARLPCAATASSAAAAAGTRPGPPAAGRSTRPSQTQTAAAQSRFVSMATSTLRIERATATAAAEESVLPPPPPDSPSAPEAASVVEGPSGSSSATELRSLWPNDGAGVSSRDCA